MQLPKEFPAFQGEGPVHYRIQVCGRLDPDWSARLAGMNIAQGDEAGPQAGCVTLDGRIRDQAELSGVLNTLYELHLRLVSVEVVE